MKIFSVFIIFTLILVSGCTAKNNFDAQNIELKCCAECKTSFESSPAGVGPGGAFCDKFPTGQLISNECENYFKSNPKTVAECDK